MYNMLTLFEKIVKNWQYDRRDLSVLRSPHKLFVYREFFTIQ